MFNYQSVIAIQLFRLIKGNTDGLFKTKQSKDFIERLLKDGSSTYVHTRTMFGTSEIRYVFSFDQIGVTQVLKTVTGQDTSRYWVRGVGKSNEIIVGSASSPTLKGKINRLLKLYTDFCEEKFEEVINPNDIFEKTREAEKRLTVAQNELLEVAASKHFSALVPLAEKYRKQKEVFDSWVLKREMLQFFAFEYILDYPEFHRTNVALQLKKEFKKKSGKALLQSIAKSDNLPEQGSLL